MACYIKTKQLSIKYPPKTCIIIMIFLSMPDHVYASDVNGRSMGDKRSIQCKQKICAVRNLSMLKLHSTKAKERKKILKTISTLSSLYSDEYPCARFFASFFRFLHHFVLAA